MWTVSDDALMAGIAAGDQDAASAFVRRFQRRVYGLARTIVMDDRAAEDVAQEAFLRAWRHAGAYDPRRRQRDRAGCSRSPATSRSTRCGCGARRRSTPRRRSGSTACPTSVRRTSSPSFPTTPSACGWRWRGLPEEQCRAIVLSGLLGYTARGGRRDGGDPARHGQDPYPHRTDPAARGASSRRRLSERAHLRPGARARARARARRSRRRRAGGGDRARQRVCALPGLRVGAHVRRRRASRC